jgi:hypothetical protein
VLLTKEIAWIDRRVADLSADRDVEIAAHRAWRARLSEDLEEIDRTPSGDAWTSLKTKMDNDLDVNRPVSIPRAYEIPYGI